MNKVQMQWPSTRAQVIEFPRAEESAEQESGIDARLQELKSLVDRFGDAAFNLFLTEKSAVREAIEELAVKVSALDWIARIARRSTGQVREGLWTDIEKALVDLEKTAELVIRATEKWAHADLGARHQRVVSQDRF
jgi:hypothetical protein